MPMELPQLDDLSYADLVDEARTAIPAIYPAWTDHNPSDPGIALVELFAWLTEMLVYRTGRITEKSRRAFLRLLCDRSNAALAAAIAGGDIDVATAETLSVLRERYRAVTPDDYEYLAAYAFPPAGASALSQKIARTRCLPERDISPTDAGGRPRSEADRTAAAPGHVSLAVVPQASDGSSQSLFVDPAPDLLAALSAFFIDRRLITTQVHVAGPEYVHVLVFATLWLRDDSKPADVKLAATQALADRFHPYRGGAGGEGWPFGRDVAVAEIYALLDQVAGVAFVEDVSLALASASTTHTQLAAIAPHQLPRVEAGDVSLTLKERIGGGFQEVSP